MYTSTLLHIGAVGGVGNSANTVTVVNPATEEDVGTVAQADRSDLDGALTAADRGFRVWRAIVPFERAKIMHKAAALLRERAELIANLITVQQGKILLESMREVLAAAEVVEWFAEEGKRSYGRIIPARAPGVYQLAMRVLIGVGSRRRSAS